MTQIKENVHKKDVESEKENLLVLQTNVATIGANIKDLTVVVDKLKDQLITVQTNANQNKENLTQIIVSKNFCE